MSDINDEYIKFNCTGCDKELCVPRENNTKPVCHNCGKEYIYGDNMLMRMSLDGGSLFEVPGIQ